MIENVLKRREELKQKEAEIGSKIALLREKLREILENNSEDPLLTETDIREEMNPLQEEYDNLDKELRIIDSSLVKATKRGAIDAVREKAPEQVAEFRAQKAQEQKEIDSSYKAVVEAVEEAGLNGYKELNEVFKHYELNSGYAKGVLYDNMLTIEELRATIKLENGKETTIFNELYKIDADFAELYARTSGEVSELDIKIAKDAKSKGMSIEEYRSNHYKGGLGYSNLLKEKLALIDSLENKRMSIDQKLYEAAMDRGEILAEKLKGIQEKTGVKIDRDVSVILQEMQEKSARIGRTIDNVDNFAEKYIEDCCKSLEDELEKATQKENDTRASIGEHDVAETFIRQDKLFGRELDINNAEEYGNQIVDLSDNIDTMLKINHDKVILKEIEDIYNELYELRKENISIPQEVKGLEERITLLTQKQTGLAADIKELEGKISEIDEELKPVIAKRESKGLGKLWASITGSFGKNEKNYETYVEEKETFESERDGKKSEKDTVSKEKDQAWAEKDKKNSRSVEINKMMVDLVERAGRLSRNLKIESQITKTSCNTYDDVEKMLLALRTELEEGERDILEKEPELAGAEDQELLEVQEKIKSQKEFLKSILTEGQISELRLHDTYNEKVGEDKVESTQEEVQDIIDTKVLKKLEDDGQER